MHSEAQIWDRRKLHGIIPSQTSSSGEHCKLHLIDPTQSMLMSAVYIPFKFPRQRLVFIKFGHQMNTVTRGRLQIQTAHEDIYNYQEN
jgi:hypothetical protein